MAVGERIREARKRKKLTQHELASALGVTQAVVGRYERGERTPKLKTLTRIAKELGVNVRDLDPQAFSYTREELLQIGDIKKQATTLIGLWTPYQAEKRLPLLRACQDLTEAELLDVLDYIRYLQTKRDKTEDDDA